MLVDDIDVIFDCPCVGELATLRDMEPRGTRHFVRSIVLQRNDLTTALLKIQDLGKKKFAMSC
jgi:hypothetical protein